MKIKMKELKIQALAFCVERIAKIHNDTDDRKMFKSVRSLHTYTAGIFVGINKMGYIDNGQFKTLLHMLRNKTTINIVTCEKPFWFWQKHTHIKSCYERFFKRWEDL